VEEEKDDVGRITYYAIKEGVEVWRKVVMKNGFFMLMVI
jgi:hypothetical protein